MGCVQSKAAQPPAAEVLPTSVKVANSIKNGIAPANPARPAQNGDPIYIDRADTEGSTGFQIKSEGESFICCAKRRAATLVGLHSDAHGDCGISVETHTAF